MSKRKRKAETFSSNEAEELTYIKRLLMLQLVSDGVDSKDIASVLGIDASAVSRTVPSQKIKKKWKKESEKVVKELEAIKHLIEQQLKK